MNNKNFSYQDLINNPAYQSIILDEFQQNTANDYNINEINDEMFNNLNYENKNKLPLDNFSNDNNNTSSISNNIRSNLDYDPSLYLETNIVNTLNKKSIINSKNQPNLNTNTQSNYGNNNFTLINQVSTIPLDCIFDIYKNPDWNFRNYYKGKVSVNPNSLIIETIPNSILNLNEKALFSLLKQYGQVDFIEFITNSVAIIYTSSSRIIDKLLNMKYVLYQNQPVFFLPNSRLKTIFIGHLDKRSNPKTIETEVKKICFSHSSIRVQADPNDSSRNKGFCFVEFDEHYFARLNYEELIKNPIINGRTVTIEWAEDLDKNYELNRKELHISGVTPEMSSEQILKIFQQFGKVQKLRLSREDNTERQDFGFITYEKEADAKNAVLKFSYYDYFSSPVVVSFSKKQEAKFYKLSNKAESYNNKQSIKNDGKHKSLKNSCEDSWELEQFEKERKAIKDAKKTKSVNDAWDTEPSQNNEKQNTSLLGNKREYKLDNNNSQKYNNSILNSVVNILQNCSDNILNSEQNSDLIAVLLHNISKTEKQIDSSLVTKTIERIITNKNSNT